MSGMKLAAVGALCGQGGGMRDPFVSAFVSRVWWHARERRPYMEEIEGFDWRDDLKEVSVPCICIGDRAYKTSGQDMIMLDMDSIKACYDDVEFRTYVDNNGQVLWSPETHLVKIYHGVFTNG